MVFIPQRRWKSKIRTRVTIGALVIVVLQGALLGGQQAGSCVVETVLGGPVFAGENVPATEARSLGINAIAVLPDGALILAEDRNHRIRRIDAQGIIQTLAGNGSPETSGDGGPAVDATVRYPQYVAVQQDGSIGFLDGDGRLREIQPNGVIHSVTDEHFDFPLSLAAGLDGSYYVGTTALSTGGVSGVRRVYPDGRMETVAGNGAYPQVVREGDGLHATEAPVGRPSDLAVDASGRLWIVESFPTPHIRRVAGDGTISTIAGGGSQPISEAPLDASSANLSGVVDLALIPGSSDAYLLVNSTLMRLVGGVLEQVAQIGGGLIDVDAGGNLYLASGERISRRSPDGALNQVAGPPLPDYAAPSIPADTPAYWLGVAVEPDGDVLLHHTRYIYRWPQGSNFVQKIAGNGQLWALDNDIPALASGFNSIRQVAGDANGGVYVADDIVPQLRYIDPSGTIRRVAGTNVRENIDTFVTTPTPATTVRLNDLDSVSVGADGMVYFTEANSGRSRVFRLDSAGLLQEYPLDAPGRVPNADLAIAAGPQTAYVLERSLSRLFRLGSESADADPGPPHPDLLQSARSFAIDEEGSLYWLGGNISTLWRLRTNGVSERITALGIGSEEEGAAATEMPGHAARSIAITASGDLLFVDTGAGRVRKIQDISSCPAAAGRVAPDRVGVYNSGVWQLDADANGAPDDPGFDFNAGPIATRITGDWNGDGKHEIGLFVDGFWFLDYDGDGLWDGGAVDRQYEFGFPGVTPFVGDWDGSGSDKVGIFINGFWYLDVDGNGIWNGPGTDLATEFGWSAVTPFVADWDGDGSDSIGFYVNGFWFVDYNANGVWEGPAIDRAADFGFSGASPLVGDWDGDGSESIGVYMDGFWYFDVNGSYAWDGPGPDAQANFGFAGVTPLVGDWTGNGSDKIGVFIDGVFYLDYDGSRIWDGGIADRAHVYGGPGDVPTVGFW